MISQHFSSLKRSVSFFIQYLLERFMLLSNQTSKWYSTLAFFFNEGFLRIGKQPTWNNQPTHRKTTNWFFFSPAHPKRFASAKLHAKQVGPELLEVAGRWTSFVLTINKLRTMSCSDIHHIYKVTRGNVYIRLCLQESQVHQDVAQFEMLSTSCNWPSTTMSLKTNIDSKHGHIYKKHISSPSFSGAQQKKTSSHLSPGVSSHLENSCNYHCPLHPTWQQRLCWNPEIASFINSSFSSWAFKVCQIFRIFT